MLKPKIFHRRRALELGAGLIWCLALVVVTVSCGKDRSPGAGTGWVPALRFDREHVILRILPGEVEVEGSYEFLCAAGGPDSLSVFYPYPQDSLLGPAETRLVESRCGNATARPVPFTEHPPAGVDWRIPAAACRRLTVRTVYRQGLETAYARYIVTTTSTWGHPLSHAGFEIHLPEGAVPVEFSFPFERDERLGPNAWVYDARDFSPAHDVTVRWRYSGEEPPG